MNQSLQIRAAVLGASGYSGGELLRLLKQHPYVDVVAAAAGSHAGKAIASIHPQLRGIYPGAFCSVEETLARQDYDTVFLALPHGESHRLVPQLPKHVRIIDLSGDFRLADPTIYAQWYGSEHRAPSLIPEFIYGLSEWFAPRLREAKKIANPGCFATAVLLGLLPLVAENIIDGTVVVDAKTGSSGSGASPSLATHHPVRAHGLNAYKAFAHQHEPEILQTLGVFGETPELIFQTHSVPLVRGIYASIYAPLKSELSNQQLAAIFASRYDHSPFIRLTETPPNIAWVQGSNFVDIGWATRGRHAAIFVALDNLMKGAAGQAVQNLNLMLGLADTTGLDFAGLLP